MNNNNNDKHEDASETNYSRSLWSNPEELRKKLGEQEIRERIVVSRLQHFYDRLEYWEESCKVKETCNHLDFSERH